MYDGIEKINNVINYIEENITKEIDYSLLAEQMCLSVYEFRRIFSFVVGCPLYEYIRKRRLSLAACEIMTSKKVNFLDLSYKYGYTSQSAFIRAFGEFHGVSPLRLMRQKCEITLFTKPSVEMRVSGREEVSFDMINDNSFFVCGVKGVSNQDDTCCCESVWKIYSEKSTDSFVTDEEKVYAVYNDNLEDGNVLCTIGARTEHLQGEGTAVQKSMWACFKVCTTDDDIINNFYSKILYEWLPSTRLKKVENAPIVEVYPIDMENEGFEWEIRVPVCR